MTIYSTKVSAHYIARRAAAQAGGTQVNFLAGTLVVGDGNGSVPAISALVAAGHVLHEVWSGDVVVAVTVDEDNAAQVDIRCVIPATIGSVEVGPFWVREFTISDENGVVCVYGTTQVEKTTSAEGAISDLTIVAAIGESDNSVVVLSPPSSNFTTGADVQEAINAHQPTAEEPIYVADTTSTSGWLQRLIRVRRAAQSPAQIGVERPATAAEFAAGAPAAAPASQWPWPTLQQIKAALDSLTTSITTSINTHHSTAEEPLYVADTTAGGWLNRLIRVRRATQSPAQIGVERPATDAEFAAGVAAAAPASQWPWPTLQQIKAALDGLTTSMTISITTLINTHHPTAEEPLYVADTTAGGWLSRIFKVRRATQSPAQIGVERPATDAEFAAGVAGGTSPWPWPTLQQVAGALTAITNALTVSGEGVAVDGAHHANLNFPALDAASALDAADELALYQPGVGHRKWSLSALVSWLHTQPPPPAYGGGVGQVIISGVNGTFLDQNPADWGYALGMTATAAQVSSGTVPGVTPGAQLPYSGATSTSSSCYFGAITGTWALIGWSFSNNAGLVAVFNLYWRRTA